LTLAAFTQTALTRPGPLAMRTSGGPSLSRPAQRIWRVGSKSRVHRAGPSIRP